MEASQLLQDIATLPPLAREELAQFLVELKLRYAQRGPLTDEEQAKWMNPEFFGMYADREDVANSTVYVRKLRNDQWATQ